MTFTLLIIHNHDRMSYIPRVLRTTTWVYFNSSLPTRFIHSPNVVKEAIMTDINDLVQEFWGTSNDGAVGTSFFAMLRLLEILQNCFDFLGVSVCFVIISVFAAAVDLAEKIYRTRQTPDSETNLRYYFMGIEKNSISHFLYVNPKIWVTCSGSYLVLWCRSK